MKYDAYIRIFKDDIPVPDLLIAGIVAKKARAKLNLARDESGDNVAFIIGELEGKKGPNESVGDAKLIKKWDPIVASTIKEIVDEANS